MYSRALDQPLYCKSSTSNLCVLCDDNWDKIKNDPGNVRYRDPQCRSAVLNRTDAIALDNNGTALDRLPSVEPKCACD